MPTCGICHRHTYLCPSIICLHSLHILNGRRTRGVSSIGQCVLDCIRHSVLIQPGEVSRGLNHSKKSLQLKQKEEHVKLVDELSHHVLSRSQIDESYVDS